MPRGIKVSVIREAPYENFDYTKHKDFAIIEGDKCRGCGLELINKDTPIQCHHWGTPEYHVHVLYTTRF